MQTLISDANIRLYLYVNNNHIQYHDNHHGCIIAHLTGRVYRVFLTTFSHGLST